jgi:threonine synthase
VVVILTGHQLKDPDYILRRRERFDAARVVIDADEGAARRAIEALLSA